MGALDDAIREHLELKRQHGASDEEIQQAEAEALGPARREPASVPGETPRLAEPVGPVAPAPVAGTEAVRDVPPPPPPAEPHPYTPAEPPPVEPPPVEAHPVEPPPVEPHSVEPASAEGAVEPPAADDSGDHGHGDDHPDDPDRARTAILDDPLGELPPLDSPPPPPVHHEPGPDEPPAPARPIDPEPRDHGAEHTVPPAPDEEEDVLEETPDFLQETPEHDRLWFEQKPPRDFDFDD
jgi:hypothetical protein